MLKLIALIVALGLDTFATATALGLTGTSGRQRLAIGALFAGFETAMILVGFAAGTPLGHLAGDAGDYAAAAVLGLLGTWILLGPEDDSRLSEVTRRRGLAAVALGLSVSIDELGMGLSLGVLRLSVAPVAIFAGVQALVVSQLGLALGGRLSERVREGSERLAGAALLVLAVALALVRLLR
jgi:putative Mn2+ efflux pump MntP